MTESCNPISNRTSIKFGNVEVRDACAYVSRSRRDGESDGSVYRIASRTIDSWLVVVETAVVLVWPCFEERAVPAWRNARIATDEVLAFSIGPIGLRVRVALRKILRIGIARNARCLRWACLSFAQAVLGDVILTWTAHFLSMRRLLVMTKRRDRN